MQSLYCTHDGVCFYATCARKLLLLPSHDWDSSLRDFVVVCGSLRYFNGLNICHHSQFSMMLRFSIYSRVERIVFGKLFYHLLKQIYS